MANEPAKQNTAETAVTSLDRMEKFHQSMRRRAKDEAENRPVNIAEEISAKNADQIFAAAMKDGASMADVWNAGTGDALQGRDIVGLETRIYGFHVDESTRTDLENATNGYYLTLDATVIGGPEEILRKLGVNIGQEVAIQTGADDPVFRLRAAELLDGFPLDAVWVGRATRSGNTVLKLRPAPVRATAGTVE